MGKKLIKIKDIIRLPGNPRFIVDVTSNNEEFAFLCTVTDEYKIRRNSPHSFREFREYEVQSDYQRSLIDGKEFNWQIKDSQKIIKASLELDFLKLSKKIRKLLDEPFASGYFLQDNSLVYYLLSDNYDLPDVYKEKFEFLPCVYDDLPSTEHRQYLLQNIKSICKFLTQSPSCLPIFLYTLSALSEPVLYYGSTHNAKFSVWVHSPEYKNARDAANLFGNMFTYRPQSVYNEHKFHFNLTEKNGYDLDEHIDSFTDLPLLGFSSSDSHKLANKKTKPIIDKTYSGNIRFYPVFISPTSTHSYKVLPLKIEDIHLKRSDFESLKGCINRVYRAFIYEMCRRNSFESVHTVVNDSFYKSLREILQSPLAYPLFHHHCVVLNCKGKNTPREFIEINNELSSIRKDIIRYIPEALDIELDISSGFQDFQYDAKKKHGENHIIYMPTLTSDSKIPYEPVDDSLYDAENFLNESFIVYCNQVISDVNKLRKAVCHCAYVYKLRYALEYFNSFMSKVGVDFQFRKQFMTEAYSALDKLLHKQPLLNTVSKEEQALIDKDISRFLKALNQTIYKNLNSDMVRNISFRISRDKSCKAYEVDSRVFRKLADAKVDTPFRQFLNELAKRDILIKNSGNPKQPRFVFQKTVNSHARNYYVVRADAIQIETYELTK